MSTRRPWALEWFPVDDVRLESVARNAVLCDPCICSADQPKYSSRRRVAIATTSRKEHRRLTLDGIVWLLAECYATSVYFVRLAIKAIALDPDVYSGICYFRMTDPGIFSSQTALENVLQMNAGAVRYDKIR